MPIMENHGFIHAMTKTHGPDSRARSPHVDRPNRRSAKSLRRRTALIAAILGLTAAVAAGFATAEYPIA